MVRSHPTAADLGVCCFEIWFLFLTNRMRRSAIPLIISAPLCRHVPVRPIPDLRLKHHVVPPQLSSAEVAVKYSSDTRSDMNMLPSLSLCNFTNNYFSVAKIRRISHKRPSLRDSHPTYMNFALRSAVLDVVHLAGILMNRPPFSARKLFSEKMMEFRDNSGILYGFRN